MDVIALNRFLFGAFAAGALPETAFVEGAVATEATHRILHDSATGNLLYDADGSGSGSAVRFATVTAGLDLSASDFILI